MNLDPLLVVDLFLRGLLWAMALFLAVAAFLAASAYAVSYAVSYGSSIRRRRREAAFLARLDALTWGDPVEVARSGGEGGRRR
ncbi:hypothetical protein ACIRP0_10710 [Streptomyces sp. NPDC101733]|uniref:hypothetical protein n=1 Tax=unclassified Streptomyces TaxID=2593676 RepID=UPI0038286C51